MTICIIFLSIFIAIADGCKPPKTEQRVGYVDNYGSENNMSFSIEIMERQLLVKLLKLSEEKKCTS